MPIYVVEEQLANVHIKMRDLGAASAALERLALIEDPTWPPIRLNIGAEVRSTYEFVNGPPGAALESVRKGLRLARLAGYDGVIPAGNLIAVELMAGDYTSAAANARALLAELGDSRNDLGQVHVRINLLGALLALGDVEQARPVAKAAWPRAQQVEHHGDCADHFALLCALEGRWSAAATLLGYADAVYARRGGQRWPTELMVHDRTIELLRDALEPAVLARLVLDGGNLPDSAVANVAFDED